MTFLMNDINNNLFQGCFVEQLLEVCKLGSVYAVNLHTSTLRLYKTIVNSDYFRIILFETYNLCFIKNKINS